jgi:hypothetical protein
VSLEVGVYGVSGVGVGLEVGIDPDQDCAAKVEHLLRRDKATQETLDRLTERMAELEADHAEKLVELRSEIEADLAVDEYGPLRWVGTGALVLGLALTTVANFV